ncbi:hypothetical protein Pmar_PMAR008715 [Perkinsus marinus ATCC 50983]|uniref:Uncharacterized protein n=1 Tax=Perkinsus marinus (strain ATCC 50983 / TXsc) TaxID=423536 RepID=C5L0T3_PERM5|nr:hypothetical protein Pmar_PMAR008715 [Perkinsus marinus ATCC 50983]EER09575.1 hypothetical protein Pmar_PMAR008715 [Perkinsus marinus ATCC 50983]|eukprot:XP_002777780.1 hypothetical protein Pmar_PMAR008715 [Perkinsus marinus ATCC 50983]
MSAWIRTHCGPFLSRMVNLISSRGLLRKARFSLQYLMLWERLLVAMETFSRVTHQRKSGTALLVRGPHAGPATPPKLSNRLCLSDASGQVNLTEADLVHVYYRNNRSQAFTQVKRIKGDIKVIKAELENICRTPARQLNDRVLELRGDHKNIIRAWLAGNGL